MCEFKVFLDGEKVAEDIVYAHVDGSTIMIRDILGRPTIFENVRLDEVNVMTTKLTISRIG